MKVLRIVPNLKADEPLALARFYGEVFGMDLPLDMGWIAFLETAGEQKVELHAASEGGSGTELPVISIEIDDLPGAETAVRAAGAAVVYGPATEPWGVQRFYFRDPAGNLVNVLSHDRG